MDVQHDLPIRDALEVQHDSFRTPELVSLLRRAGVSLVVADAAGLLPLIEEVTTDFVYVRLHGSGELYRSASEPDELDTWAQKIRVWQAGTEPPDARRLTEEPVPLRPRDVYVYFDNDIGTHAPFDALALMKVLQRGSAPGDG